MKPAMMLAALAMLVASIPQAFALDYPVIGGNLIENGSFEDGPLGPVPAGEVPPGWWREAYSANGQLAIVADAAPGEGTQCVRMTATSDDSTGLHGPLIEIDATQAYVQCGWIRMDGAADRSGLNLGRQWFGAEGESVEQPSSRSYTYVVSGANPGAQWRYYEQLLLPDPTPDDGASRADEIPAMARALRVWALNYRWNGAGYFDGLGLYRVDYAAMARPAIVEALEAAHIDEAATELRETLAALPEDTEGAGRARALLAELDALRARALAEAERPVLEWMADQDRTPALIEELQDARWEMKIRALLRAAG